MPARCAESRRNQAFSDRIVVDILDRIEHFLVTTAGMVIKAGILPDGMAKVQDLSNLIRRVRPHSSHEPGKILTGKQREHRMIVVGHDHECQELDLTLVANMGQRLDDDLSRSGGSEDGASPLDAFVTK
jgi:hypothetical protein